MKGIPFQEFKNMCILNIKKKYSKGILNLLNEEVYTFHSGVIGEQKYLSALYETRLKIAKKSNKLSELEIKDYQNCVTQMKKTTSEKIGICSLYTQNYSFLIFYVSPNLALLGILKFESLDRLNLLDKC